jgi:hypothetical protein
MRRFLLVLLALWLVFCCVGCPWWVLREGWWNGWDIIGRTLFVYVLFIWGIVLFALISYLRRSARKSLNDKADAARLHNAQ